MQINFIDEKMHFINTKDQILLNWKKKIEKKKKKKMIGLHDEKNGKQ
jgi:hypothetical protein